MAKKKASRRPPPGGGGLMKAPADGVTVRMYRQGHGDCFLLAFPQAGRRPYYVLIDCGMKKGSQLPNGCTMAQAVQSIWDATGGHLNLVVITHEHEDHVSGFRSEQSLFSKMTIDRLWLAWTEDPEHAFANQLRKKYKDVLLGLASAVRRFDGLGAGGQSDGATARKLRSLLEFELADGELAALTDEVEAPAAAAKVAGRTNKEGVLVVKGRAEKTEYLRPHLKPLALPGVDGVRVFVLGPPENEASLKDMDPRGEEEFHLAAAAAEERAFLAAVAGDGAGREAHQPFEESHRIPAAASAQSEHARFFANHYYGDSGEDASWRRIDGDWLRSSEQFALRMNTFVNNTSLVLAFELPKSKRVLLFVGDAQRGNWASWHEKEWSARVGGATERTTAADLLNRTVFYKVGHHGSHNATMNARGLKEMAQGEFADEFVAMIPAHEKWALTSNDPPWRHPLKAILKAVAEKARGRVFVMDRELEEPSPRVLPRTGWTEFLGRCDQSPLYHEVTIRDDA